MINTTKNEPNPFDELFPSTIYGIVSGAHSSWQTVFGQICLVSFGLMWVSPYIETKMGLDPSSKSWAIPFFFWTAAIFGIMWLVARKRQERQLYKKSSTIDVSDLPRRDPTAFGSGLVGALAKWGIGLLAFLVVCVIGLYPPINELMRNNNIVMGMFVVMILVLGVVMALFISHRSPTDTSERFERFASRNKMALNRGNDLPVWANELFGQLTPSVAREWSLRGEYMSHQFDITLLRQSDYRKKYTSKSIYVVRIAGIQLATGDDTLQSELAKYDSMIGPIRPYAESTLYVAGRNQVFNQVNFLRVFAVIDTAINGYPRGADK